MSRAHDVIVIGGGAVGSSIAYHLAENHSKVLLLDRQAMGGRATRAAAGMLAAQEEAGDDDAFLKFALESRDLFKTLAPKVKELSGVDPEWAVTGVARAAVDPAEAEALRRKVDHQSKKGLPARWLSAKDATEAFPGLMAPDGAFLAPEDGVVNPFLWAKALSESARRRGAKVQEFTPAVTLIKEGRRVVGIRTEKESILAGHVILAAGAWTPFVLGELEVKLPLEPVKGQLLILAGVLGEWKTPVYAGAGYLVPRPDGRILVGATVERVGFDERPTLDAQRQLAEWAARWCPSLSSRPVSSVNAGLRPGSADGLPVLGPVPGWEGVSLACGHHRNGILLSALTGKMVAAAVISGTWDNSLAPFSPARFSPAPLKTA